MINALVLKNDEAGISGIGMACSNTKHTDKASTFVKADAPVTTRKEARALCPKGRKLCHPTQIDAASTDILKGWTSKGIVESNLLDYRIEQNRSVCLVRDMTKEECKKYAEQPDHVFKEGSTTDGPVDFSAGKTPLPKVQRLPNVLRKPWHDKTAGLHRIWGNRKMDDKPTTG